MLKKNIITILCPLILFSALLAQNNNNKANHQLLEAINHNDMQQVIEACHNGADFLTFTSEQFASIKPNNFLNIYQSINDVRTSITFNKLNLSLCEDDDPMKAQILGKLANSYYTIGDIFIAETLYIELIQIQRKILGERHPDYAICLNNLAFIYEKKGDYTSAEPLYREVIQIRKETVGEHHPDYAKSLNELALLYYHMGEFVTALELFKNSTQIFRDVLGERHPDYATSLNNLALLYREMGDYSSAMQILTESIQIQRDVLGEQHQDYATSLNNLASLYQASGDYPTAESLFYQSMTIRLNVLREHHPDYAASLNNLALLYREMGDLEKAKRFLTQSLQIDREVLGEKHPICATALDNLASLYRIMGDYQMSDSLFKESIQIRRETLGERNPLYASTINNLAQLYRDMGDYSLAEKLYKETIQIIGETLGETHPHYATSLSNLAMLYIDMGDYSSSQSLLKKSQQIYMEILGRQHPDYATSLNNLGLLYMKMGDYSSAKPLLLESTQIIKDKYGEQNPTYASCLCNLANQYENMGDYNSAESLLRKSMQIRKETIGEKHPEYAHSLNNLACLLSRTGAYASAEPLFNESLQIRREALGENHPDFVNTLYNLALLYCKMNDYPRAEQFFLEAQTKRIIEIRDYFDFLSERQRDSFWNSKSPQFDTSFPGFAYVFYPQKKSISAFAYDNELFMKGLLLHASQQMQDAVLASGDSLVIEDYNHLKSVKERIIFLQQQPLERQFGLDSLLVEAERLDKELTLRCKEYRLNQENMTITWEKVRDHLSEGSVSVEFSSFNIEEDSEIHKKLVAILLRDDSEYPQYIVIGNEEDIIPLLDSDPQVTYQFENNGNKLYSMIWKPLEEYIHDGETVFFAPAGILHQVNLSALPLNQTEVIADRYDLVHLSSTRELAVKRDSYSRDKVLIYGALEYDMDSESMLRESKATGERHFATRGLEEVEGLGGVDYLFGTIEEIEHIERICQQHGIDVDLYRGASGNEESFKAINGGDNNIIHIATHGFFFPNEEAKKEKLFVNLLDDQTQTQDRYIDPLLRCGLLFAGSNMAWTGRQDELPQQVEDGILTAKEISLLDLGKADLIVMSACETGKGDIASDGVFGLQRGFKQAGANSLLMSLWKVHDQATCLLMTEFYNQLLSGKSKRESLRIAQKKLRDNPSFSDPQYWGAFVLLDALD